MTFLKKTGLGAALILSSILPAAAQVTITNEDRKVAKVLEEYCEDKTAFNLYDKPGKDRSVFIKGDGGCDFSQCMGMLEDGHVTAIETELSSEAFEARSPILSENGEVRFYTDVKSVPVELEPGLHRYSVVDKGDPRCAPLMNQDTNVVGDRFKDVLETIKEKNMCIVGDKIDEVTAAYEIRKTSDYIKNENEKDILTGSKISKEVLSLQKRARHNYIIERRSGRIVAEKKTAYFYAYTDKKRNSISCFPAQDARRIRNIEDVFFEQGGK